MTQLWGDTVWIGVINDGKNANVPYFSRSFNWAAGTDGQRRRVKQYRMADEGQEGDWIEVAEAHGREGHDGARPARSSSTPSQ
jgi:hypothetical protein